MNSEPNHNRNATRWANAAAVLGAFLIVWILIWAMRHYTRAPDLNAKRAAERAQALAELRAAEADTLHNPGWIDPDKGVVRLPIEDAMRLVEREWRNPAAARSNLIARVEKATTPPPKAPEKPNPFE